jgi:hypothetical protein
LAERFIYTEKAAGPNPAPPTKKLVKKKAGFLFTCSLGNEKLFSFPSEQVNIRIIFDQTYRKWYFDKGEVA